MHIHLDQVSKRYGYQYILRDIQLDIQSNSYIGIAGPNGSGKSTFLKLLSGYLSPSEGRITYMLNERVISREQIYKHISVAAPYIDLINEYRLKEIFSFHHRFKSMLIDSYEDFYLLLDYPYDQDLKWYEYSSGMQQRIKLALAILTKSDLLLLDEPTTYLDARSKDWFHQLLSNYTSGRTIIICSNDEQDFQSCKKMLQISDWK